ncbi:hypothetical protein [Streptomyces violascens]|uniref:hypothetical protein n=1 Tax=Streptomyces violascens TaxID=67381 RepID=UPI00365A2119
MKVGITGRRGLSPEVEQQACRALAEAVKAYEPAEPVDLSCITGGPDTWFAQAVLACGGQAEVVMPAEQYRAALCWAWTDVGCTRAAVNLRLGWFSVRG